MPQGISTLHRTDGRLFNLNRSTVKNKISHTSVTGLHYADDNTIVTHFAEDLQGILIGSAKAYGALGLDLNIKSTQVFLQPPPNLPATQPTIKVATTTISSPTSAAFSLPAQT